MQSIPQYTNTENTPFFHGIKITIVAKTKQKNPYFMEASLNI